MTNEEKNYYDLLLDMMRSQIAGYHTLQRSVQELELRIRTQHIEENTKLERITNQLQALIEFIHFAPFENGDTATPTELSSSTPL